LKLAAYWFEKAAKQGHPRAQYFLGGAYALGHGVPQDDRQAVYWYQKAAAQNDPIAQTDLAECYQRGWGVARDLPKAIYWYTQAANQNDTKAQMRMGLYYMCGQRLEVGLEKDCTDGDRIWRNRDDKNDPLALSWFLKAANLGDPTGQFMASMMYAAGRGALRNATESLRWARASAEKGYKGGMEMLGAAYEQGALGLPKDPKMAAYWYDKAKAAEKIEPGDISDVGVKMQKTTN